MDNGLWWNNFDILLAGLGGALLGSGVSALLAWHIAKAEKLEKQKSEFFQLMIKLSLIHTDFFNLHKLIVDQIREGEGRGLTGQPLWTKVQANAGKLDRIHIQTEELVCLYQARQFNEITSIVELGLKHAVIVDGFNTYSELRAKLKDYMPKHGVSGSIVTAGLTEQQLMEVSPRLMELDSTINAVAQKLPEYCEVSKSLVERLGPLGKKIFRDENFQVWPYSGVTAGCRVLLKGCGTTRSFHPPVIPCKRPECASIQRATRNPAFSPPALNQSWIPALRAPLRSALGRNDGKWSLGHFLPLNNDAMGRKTFSNHPLTLYS